jgi:hypothetical protein
MSKKIGECPDWQCDERLWHAGLSDDGARCFVAGFEDNVYVVWDIAGNKVIWRDDGTNGNSAIQPLENWIGADGYVTVETGEGRGRYRLFGLELNYSKTESITLHQVLEVDEKVGLLRVRDSQTREIVCELPFEALSGDWAFASFSHNDAVIAVLEPYSVTFFGRTDYEG